MSRALRFDFPGAYWHVYNRGVDLRSIYMDDGDRHFFRELLARVCKEYWWSVLSYTEMTNHYHVFIHTKEATLSRGMQMLDGDFATHFNKRHERVGALFQSRFKAQLVDSEEYLFELSRYVVLNPVRAGLVRSARDWIWSSYRATAGLERPPGWLDCDAILNRFDARNRERATRLYRDYVAAGIGIARSPWEDLRANFYLGSSAFVTRIDEIHSTSTTAESPRRRQEGSEAIPTAIVAAAVEQHFQTPLAPKRMTNEFARLAFAILARREAIATHTAIAERLDLTVSGVRSLLSRAERREVSDDSFKDHMSRLDLELFEQKRAS